MADIATAIEHHYSTSSLTSDGTCSGHIAVETLDDGPQSYRQNSKSSPHPTLLKVMIHRHSICCYFQPSDSTNKALASGGSDSLARPDLQPP